MKIITFKLIKFIYYIHLNSLLPSNIFFEFIRQVGKKNKQKMKTNIKTITSPRSYLFHQGKLSKTHRVTEIHTSKDQQQHSTIIANNIKSKKLPISINQFKKQKQPYNPIKTIQISNNRKQKSHILNKRIHNHQLTQLIKNTISFDQKDNITCRSRKKRGRFFLNLSPKNTVSGNSISKDKQITYIIRNDDHTCRSVKLHSTLSPYRNKSQHNTNRIQYKETLVKQSNKYQKIRSTMKKLKNLSEIKQLQQKKSRRLQTTVQQWNCIEEIIEKITIQINNNRCGPIETVTVVEPIKLVDNHLQQEQYDQQRLQQQTLCQVQHQNIKKIQQAETDFSQDNQQKQNNDQIFELQDITQIQQQKQFNICGLLLLIYQRIFSKVDFIIPKVQDLCAKYQIQSAKAICYFLKVLYFNRKLVEIILMHEQNINDFAGNLKQIKQENHILYEILNGTCTKYNKSMSNKPKLSVITVPQIIDSIESLKSLIESKRLDYISSNLKTLKKILKNISKDEKTIQKQLQIFLNYAVCFINLLKSHKVIQNIVTNLNYLSPQNQKQILQQQFLYNQFNFIQQKYLKFDEIQFERHFADQIGHQQIQHYYHRLIRQMKYVGEMKTKE